jgi:hypothetical protein
VCPFEIITSLAGFGILPVSVFHMINRAIFDLLFMNPYGSMAMNTTYMMILTAQ